jgi:hypothetical protein
VQRVDGETGPFLMLAAWPTPVDPNEGEDRPKKVYGHLWNSFSFEPVCTTILDKKIVGQDFFR